MPRSSASASSITAWSCTASPSTAHADAPPSTLLATARLVLLFAWLALCAPIHIVTRRLTKRSRWPRRFLAGVARIVGVRWTMEGAPVRSPTLLASNHRSWLDIPILAAATDAAFVAKAELRAHWLMRWLCEQHGTLFIDRGDRRGVGEQAATLEAALEGDRPLVLFPEGTVSPTADLLPFRPPLFAAVAGTSKTVAIRPVALDYGASLGEVAWLPGESGIANFRKILGRRGRIAMTVRLLDPLSPSEDRKVLARTAKARITDALALSRLGAVPYRDGRP